MLIFVPFLLRVVVSVSQVTEAPVLAPTSTAGVLKMGRFQVRLLLLEGSVCERRIPNMGDSGVCMIRNFPFWGGSVYIRNASVFGNQIAINDMSFL